jgi:hypothetical protein
VFSVQVGNVFKIWATPCNKGERDKMTKEMAERFNKKKTSFISSLNGAKRILPGLRLRSIVWVVKLDLSVYDRFVGERLVVDCNARVGAVRLEDHFVKWRGERDPAEIKGLHKFFKEAFVYDDKSVWVSIYEGDKKIRSKQTKGYFGVGICGEDEMMGTHPYRGKKASVRLVDAETKEVVGVFKDQREVAVHVGRGEDNVSILKKRQGLLLGKYQIEAADE